MRRRIRRSLGIVVVLCCVSSLTACGSEDPLPADQAAGHYESFVDDLTQALAADGETWSHEEATLGAEERDGVCYYTPGGWSRNEKLPSLHSAAEWQELLDAVNPVFEKYDVKTVDEPIQPTSRKVVRTHDGHGVLVEITPEKHVWVAGAAVDAEPCTLEALGLS